MRKSVLVIGVLLLFSLSFVVAESLIDISINQKGAVAIGENLSFEVRLLSDGVPVFDSVRVYFSDVLEKKVIEMDVVANEKSSLLIGGDFPSGLWNIRAVAGVDEVERSFSVAENSDVEFLIEGDKLIIRNSGNVRYTKTIEIFIGGERQAKTLNIKVGDEKEWRLMAPKGSYDIRVTDGVKTLNRQNIQLFGTGNVIGAVDEEILGTGLIGASSELGDGERDFSLSKLPLTLVFVGAIFGLAVLLGIQRHYAKKGK